MTNCHRFCQNDFRSGAKRRLPVGRCLLFTMLLLNLAVPASRGEEPATPVNATQIGDWIRQLDSNSFDARRDATRQLIEAGEAATTPVATALHQGSRELSMRGVHILEQLALADDSATREAALLALNLVASSSQSHVAKQRAQNSIASMQRLLQEKALASLVKLGAKVSFQEFADQGAVPIMFSVSNSVELGSSWTGTPKDLRLLERLVDLDVLIMSGPSFNDAYLEHLASAPRLNTLTVSHTVMTHDGLAKLAQVESLRTLQIFYTPISDAAVAALATLAQVRAIDLYGTELSVGAVGDLRNRLVSTEVRFHRGGFLGIGQGNFPPADEGLVVGRISPGSCAEKSGIELADVITQVGESKIQSFEDLQEEMKFHRHGEEIEVSFTRKNVSMKRTLTLGERSLDVALESMLPMMQQAIPGQIPVVPPPLPRAPAPNR